MSRRRARLERSAGGVVVRGADGATRVLLIRDPYENWGLPKGHVEPGEAARDAAVREVREETGLDDVVVEDEIATIDWYFRHDEQVVHKFCTFFLMRSERGEAVPERDEGITDCVWVGLDEVADHITYDNARAVVQQVVERLSDGEGEP